MKNIYILLTLAAFIIVPTGISNAQELVVNGDLELWDDPNNPTSWDKAESISQATTPIHGGTYSAGHTSSDSGTQDFQQNISGIVGGANYTISYYFLDNVTDAKTRIWSYWLDGTSTIPDHAAELRPGSYSSDNPDWQLFTVALTAPANANGFRFEVRVYHEDNNTGGLVYYDDFSFMAAGITPEPSNYPTGFDALSMGISINLAWTDAIGGQLPSAYLILASTEDNITAPVDGTAVADDVDLSDGSGALNISYGVEQCTFFDLESNTPYYFKIFPYTNGGADIDYKNDGTPPASTATTADVTIIESENFNDGWGNWSRVSVSGEQVWEIDDEHGVGDTPCAKMSGYAGQTYANEDWLISPPMNFNNYTDEVINFYNADAYDGTALEALISNDYDGIDPTTASWDPMTFETSSGYFEWISSGDIDISEINGEAVYIAFKYTSTSQEAATWEVDEILITGSEITGLGEQNNFSAQLNIYPNPAVNIVNITTDADLSLKLQIYSLLGTKVMEEQSFTGSTNIDLAGIRNGIYLLHFTDQNGNTGIEKLVIEK